MPVYKSGVGRGLISLRRATSAIGQAVAVLAKYGGSLWVASPEYTFTGSDGTGAAGDGSDAGYVQDLCASYGPELVVNGDFSQGATGWSIIGAGGVLTPAGGALQITGGTSPGIRQSILTAGKTYQITYWTRRISGTAAAFVSAGGTGHPVDPAGQMFTRVFTAAGLQLDFGISGDASSTVWEFDNISVREIVGRPLFQATTGFKPKLKRVPKRLGTELVTNGNFAASSDWAGAGGTVAISGGQLTLTSSGLGYAARAENQNQMALKPGTSYLLAATGSGGSFRLGTAKGLADLYGTSSLPAGYSSFTWQATASSAYFSLAGSSVSGTQHTFTQASVREVLEWTWAWVFDGTDDLLATVSQPAVTGESFIIAGRIATPTVSPGQPLMAKRTGNDGSMIRRESTGITAAHVVEAGGTFKSATLRSPDVDLSRHVYAQKVTASLNVARLDGVQSGQIACTPNPVATAVQVGAALTNRLNGEIYAAAYCPTALTDAEMLIIERAQAQLGGITI